MNVDEIIKLMQAVSDNGLTSLELDVYKRQYMRRPTIW